MSEHSSINLRKGYGAPPERRFHVFGYAIWWCEENLGDFGWKVYDWEEQVGEHREYLVKLRTNIMAGHVKETEVVVWIDSDPSGDGTMFRADPMRRWPPPGSPVFEETSGMRSSNGVVVTLSQQNFHAIVEWLERGSESASDIYAKNRQLEDRVRTAEIVAQGLRVKLDDAVQELDRFYELLNRVYQVLHGFMNPDMQLRISQALTRHERRVIQLAAEEEE